MRGVELIYFLRLKDEVDIRVLCLQGKKVRKLSPGNAHSKTYMALL
jgi:hypothetical protein